MNYSLENTVCKIFTFLRKYYQNLLLHCTFNPSLIFFFIKRFFFLLWILKPLLNSLQFPFYFVFAFFFVCKPGGILASQPGIQPVSPYPLHWKAKSQPLNFQESPGLVYALQIVGGDIESPALWTPFTHIPGRLRVHPLCGSDPGSHDPMPFSLSAPWAALVCDLLSAFACLSGP